jgi:hypothetical protein
MEAQRSRFSELGELAANHNQCRKASRPRRRCCIVRSGDDCCERVQAARDVQQDFIFTIGVHFYHVYLFSVSELTYERTF